MRFVATMAVAVGVLLAGAGSAYAATTRHVSLSSPAAVNAALSACPDVVGWFGASAIERLPIERAVREATAAFKHANPAGLALDGTP
jgi:predicted TIM-barrel enzyme